MNSLIAGERWMVSMAWEGIARARKINPATADAKMVVVFFFFHVFFIFFFFFFTLKKKGQLVTPGHTLMVCPPQGRKGAKKETKIEK